MCLRVGIRADLQKPLGDFAWRVRRGRTLVGL